MHVRPDENIRQHLNDFSCLWFLPTIYTTPRGQCNVFSDLHHVAPLVSLFLPTVCVPGTSEVSWSACKQCTKIHVETIPSDCDSFNPCQQVAVSRSSTTWFPHWSLSSRVFFFLVPRQLIIDRTFIRILFTICLHEIISLMYSCYMRSSPVFCCLQDQFTLICGTDGEHISSKNTIQSNEQKRLNSVCIIMSGWLRTVKVYVAHIMRYHAAAYFHGK